jgi:hypothetical protein
MTDAELVRAFEACALDPFPHALHVRAAWCYLRTYPLLEAIARFSRALQRFAAAKGKPDRYHETITIAFALIIAERLGAARELDWDGFAARNHDLLQWQPSVLDRYYADNVLTSARAREVFVLPAVQEE